MRRLARLSAVLCVILLGVSCNADTPTEPPAAEPPAPPTEDPPPPPPQGNTNVSFGASVPAVVRERASHFVGLGGMTPTDAPHGVDAPAGSLIMAVDVEGNAILAGYSAADLTAALDARTSALFIARLFADPTWLVPEADQVLEQALSAHPDFPALTDSIASRAARGLTLDATETVVQAFTLADQLAPRPSSARAGGPAAADAGGRLPSRAQFERYAFMSAHMTDSDRTSGGMVALSNSALIPMSVTAPAGTFTIASVSFCAVCLWGPMPKTVGSFIVAADGPFDVSVRLDRDVMVAQALFDMIGLFFAGVKIDMAEKKVAGEAFMGFVTSGVDALGQGLANESVYDAGVVMYQWFAAQAASETFISLVGPLLGGVAAEPGKVIAKNIANGLNKAATAIDIGRIGWSFKEAWKYWDEPPETVRWCIEDKALYGGCSETIEITPDSVQLAMGTSMPLVATVLDDQDRYLEGRKVAWTSGDLAVARFQGDHAHTIAALVSAAGTPGKAVITASTPNGAIGKARVYVADPTVLIALDYVHPDQWVPTARQYHAADTIPVINGIHFPHLRQPGDGSTAQFGNWDNNYPRQLADTIVEAFGIYTLHVSNEPYRMLHGRVLRTHHISNPDSWQTRTFISVDHFNYVTNNPGDPDGPTDNGAFPYEWLHGPSWQILRCADGSTRALHGVVGRIYFGGVTVLLLEDGSVRFADDRAGVCPDAEPHGVVLSG